MEVIQETCELRMEDFKPGVEPRWCPGCGNNVILTAVQKLLPDMGIRPEQYVFVSGIGCSSRFPYYIDTYGFHGLHGRAPAIATGVKLVNPDLKVWVITGDGDSLGIGGNHFIHLLRRNPDMVVLLFNNQIYGLTKGQTSPTTGLGIPTKSAPQGSVDYPFNPVALALGAGGSFVARVMYNDVAMMTDVFREAIAHKGLSFIEIYDNCKIFADDAFTHLTDKEKRGENQLKMARGKPLIFGSARNKGLRFDHLKPSIVDLPGGEADAGKEDVIVYDDRSLAMAQAIASLHHPEFPVPLGIFYREDRECFENYFRPSERHQSHTLPSTEGADERLRALFSKGQTWTVG